jgi:hypothetical protein
VTGRRFGSQPTGPPNATAARSALGFKAVLAQAQPESPVFETSARSALADRLVIGSMRRLADGEHGGDQVIQRSGQVVLGD